MMSSLGRVSPTTTVTSDTSGQWVAERSWIQENGSSASGKGHGPTSI